MSAAPALVLSLKAEVRKTVGSAGGLAGGCVGDRPAAPDRVLHGS